MVSSWMGRWYLTQNGQVFSGIGPCRWSKDEQLQCWITGNTKEDGCMNVGKQVEDRPKSLNKSFFYYIDWYSIISYCLWIYTQATQSGATSSFGCLVHSRWHHSKHWQWSQSEQTYSIWHVTWVWSSFRCSSQIPVSLYLKIEKWRHHAFEALSADPSPL